jgi:hypothetical protein
MKERKALHTVYTKAFLLWTAEIQRRETECSSIVFITNDLPTMNNHGLVPGRLVTKLTQYYIIQPRQLTSIFALTAEFFWFCISSNNPYHTCRGRVDQTSPKRSLFHWQNSIDKKSDFYSVTIELEVFPIPKSPWHAQLLRYPQGQRPCRRLIAASVPEVRHGDERFVMICAGLCPGFCSKLCKVEDEKFVSKQLTAILRSDHEILIESFG